MVAEAVVAGVAGAAVVEADEEPEEAVPHFSVSSPIAAMANLCCRITLAAFATPFFSSWNTLDLDDGVAVEADILQISATKFIRSDVGHKSSYRDVVSKAPRDCHTCRGRSQSCG